MNAYIYIYTGVGPVRKNGWGRVDFMFCWIPSRGGFHSACPVTNSVSISVTNAVTNAITISVTILLIISIPN